MQSQDAERQIREHMEVLGSDGGHVGTVDKVEDGRIKLTGKDDPGGSGEHHRFLSLEAVASATGGQVRLGVPAEQAKRAAPGGASCGGGGEAPGTGGLDKGMGARAGVTGAGSMVAGNPGTGNLGMRDGVADLGPEAGPAGMSGDGAPGTIPVRGGGGGTGGRDPGA